MSYQELDTFGAFCVPDENGHCITCSDEGIPARVVAVTPELALATVETEGEQLEAALDLLDGVRVGDTVLIHAGFAIAQVKPVEPIEGAT